MTISRPIVAAAAALALALPLAATAQTTPSTQPAAGAAEGHHHHRGGFGGRALKGITLSDAQKAQMKQIRETYRAAHPEGSTPDPSARKAMREQMLGVLTADQRAQYEANVKQMRNERKNEPPQGGPFAPNPSPTP